MTAKIVHGGEMVRADNNLPEGPHREFFIVLGDDGQIIPYGITEIKPNIHPRLKERLYLFDNKEIKKQDIIALGELQDECGWKHWNFFYRAVNAMLPLTFSFNFWDGRQNSRATYNRYRKENISLEKTSSPCSLTFRSKNHFQWSKI